MRDLAELTNQSYASFAMAFSDFLDHYHAITDDELTNLATEAEQLGPEAREALAAELSRRGINSEKISVYQKDEETASIEEKESRAQSIALLSPGLNRIRQRFADWRKYHDQTNKWPWKSIAFYFSHLPFQCVVLLFLAWYGLQHGWTKWRFVAVVLALITADVWVSDRAEKRIRLSEIQRYRAQTSAR